MPRSMQRTVYCALLAIAFVMGAPQAFAAPARSQPQAASVAVVTPPAGFVHEDSFYGTASACQTRGKSGIADGSWIAYVCIQTLPLTPFQDLYVKK
ncbi:hypothetical protein ACIRD6_37080 [Streptomyces sp. NPDC102473]|uniref:hypothetical protein n=1 Tax=Streptomyces sp. NPDC102473 TaxID=3366180 RepID=UPI003806C24E